MGLFNIYSAAFRHGFLKQKQSAVVLGATRGVERGQWSCRGSIQYLFGGLQAASGGQMLSGTLKVIFWRSKSLGFGESGSRFWRGGDVLKNQHGFLKQKQSAVVLGATRGVERGHWSFRGSIQYLFGGLQAWVFETKTKCRSFRCHSRGRAGPMELSWVYSISIRRPSGGLWRTDVVRDIKGNILEVKKPRIWRIWKSFLARR